MKSCKWLVGSALLALAMPLQVQAQEGVGDVVYVPTPQIVVEAMLRMAKVGPRDFVIDLGSGDGRMVITAAKQFGARGFGVDLDTVLIKISSENAQREGVSDRATFIEQNLFETDLTRATVITSYLLPEMNQKLRPKILALRPGTRVVAHDYHMGEWYPDGHQALSVPEKTVGHPGKSHIYMYIVPARIGGHWQSQINTGGQTATWDFEFKQRFQMFKGVASCGSQRYTLRTKKLEGDAVSFLFLTEAGDDSTRYEFTGTVKGDVMEGTLRLGEGARQTQAPWRAKFLQRAAAADGKRGLLMGLEPTTTGITTAVMEKTSARRHQSRPKPLFNGGSSESCATIGQKNSWWRPGYESMAQLCDWNIEELRNRGGAPKPHSRLAPRRVLGA